MLGRLDEDLSCANSRLFRATLYANQDVSAFLREHFVLYWSSERPVPRVTIDYGDGRRLERTTTGNSAHYVLDERRQRARRAARPVCAGRVSPRAGRQPRARRAPARHVRRGARDGWLVDYHQQRVIAARRDWERLAATRRIVAPWQLTTAPRVRGRRSPLPSCATCHEGGDGVEGPAPIREGPRTGGRCRKIKSRCGPRRVRSLYGIGDRQGAVPTRARRGEPRADRSPAQSRCRASCARPIEQRDAMIARLEQTIVADSALNQLRLRPQIGREIVRQRGRDRLRDAECLDLRRGVSHTAAGRLAWPLAARLSSPALPGDGVVMR